jgi:hypothetical protein
MDAGQFDSLLRAFTPGSSRRGVLVGLTTGLLAVLPRALGSEDTADFPGTPGIFCSVDITGPTGCGCNTGDRTCVPPCPN